ncbi:MAG: hypothetical protein PHO41_11555, partial [Eubacteriales bacterium]|nr:hypothetical protein [Eubacteriales bacterium]
MHKPKKTDFYICCNQAYISHAEQLAEALAAYQRRCVYTQAAASMQSEIEALRDARAMIVILSPECVNNQFIEKLLSTALYEKKPLFGIRLPDYVDTPRMKGYLDGGDIRSHDEDLAGMA